MGLQVQGLASVIAQQQRIRAHAQNSRPFLETEAPRLKAAIDKAWSEERDPATGRAWPAYKDDADGGSLRTAHRVTAEDKGLAVAVPHEAASFQFARRNPLPFKPGGAERAGEFWEGHDERLERFLSGDEENGR